MVWRLLCQVTHSRGGQVMVGGGALGQVVRGLGGGGSICENITFPCTTYAVGKNENIVGIQ